MNPLAKKIAIVVIVFLAGSVIMLWSLGKEESRPSSAIVATAGSSTPKVTITPEQQLNITQAVADSFIKEEGKTGGLDKSSLTNAYPSSSFAYTSDNSVTRLKQYGSEVAAAMAPLSVSRTNESVLMASMLENSDGSKSERIANAGAMFESISVAMKAIVVPTKAKSIHISLTNTAKRNSLLLANMSNALSNPQLGIESALAYQNSLLSLYSDMDALNKFFADSHVYFDKNDNIKVLMNLEN